MTDTATQTATYRGTHRKDSTTPARIRLTIPAAYLAYLGQQVTEADFRGKPLEIMVEVAAPFTDAGALKVRIKDTGDYATIGSVVKIDQG